jgi:hypothetical protein
MFCTFFFFSCRINSFRVRRWSMAFLRTSIILNALANLTFFVFFLVIVLKVTLVLQYGILWICYTAIQGGLLALYLIALLAYYMRNHENGVPVWPHATSLVVLFAFMVLFFAYAVTLTPIIVWLRTYPTNWLGTAAESSPVLSDSTQMLTFLVAFLIGIFATAIAMVALVTAFVSALYPTRIVNSLIAYRATVTSLSARGPATPAEYTMRSPMTYGAAHSYMGAAVIEAGEHAALMAHPGL